jgi:hypothetical protein
MATRRPLPPDAEVQISGRIHPFVVNGGNTVKTLSAAFLADLQEDWLAHGKKVFPVLRDKFPQAYFNGLVALSRIIRWEDVSDNVFDRTLTPEQVMDRLEERVGPEGRKLFEQFIRKVNKLQAKQQLEAQAQMGTSDAQANGGRVSPLANDLVAISAP